MLGRLNRIFDYLGVPYSVRPDPHGSSTENPKRGRGKGKTTDRGRGRGRGSGVRSTAALETLKRKGKIAKAGLNEPVDVQYGREIAKSLKRSSGLAFGEMRSWGMGLDETVGPFVLYDFIHFHFFSNIDFLLLKFLYMLFWCRGLETLRAPWPFALACRILAKDWTRKIPFRVFLTFRGPGHQRRQGPETKCCCTSGGESYCRPFRG